MLKLSKRLLKYVNIEKRSSIDILKKIASRAYTFTLNWKEFVRPYHIRHLHIELPHNSRLHCLLYRDCEPHWHLTFAST